MSFSLNVLAILTVCSCVLSLIHSWYSRYKHCINNLTSVLHDHSNNQLLLIPIVLPSNFNIFHVAMSFIPCFIHMNFTLYSVVVLFPSFIHTYFLWYSTVIYTIFKHISSSFQSKMGHDFLLLSSIFCI